MGKRRKMSHIYPPTFVYSFFFFSLKQSKPSLCVWVFVRKNRKMFFSGDFTQNDVSLVSYNLICCKKLDGGYRCLSKTQVVKILVSLCKEMSWMCSRSFIYKRNEKRYKFWQAIINVQTWTLGASTEV